MNGLTNFLEIAESGVVVDVRAKVGDDTSIGDKSGQQFSLLLRMTQPNGRPLSVGGFTGWAMS